MAPLLVLGTSWEQQAGVLLVLVSAEGILQLRRQE